MSCIDMAVLDGAGEALNPVAPATEPTQGEALPIRPWKPSALVFMAPQQQTKAVLPLLALDSRTEVGR